MLLQALCIISYPLVNSNWSYSPETPNLGQIRRFWEPCDLVIWRMTLKNNLHLPVRALSKVLLLPVWVWLVLPSTAYSKSMLPLDLWCQASLQGLPERHLVKTVHCWGWSDRIVSWVLGPWRRGWEICTESVRAGRTTVNNRLLSRGYRAYRPTTKPLLTDNHRRLRLESVQRWRNLTVAHWQHVIFGDESRFQLYPVDGRLRVRRLPGERFRPACQAHRVQAGGGSVHVWGAFHNSAKSPLVLPDGYLTFAKHLSAICQALFRGQLPLSRWQRHSSSC